MPRYIAPITLPAETAEAVHFLVVLATEYSYAEGEDCANGDAGSKILSFG